MDSQIRQLIAKDRLREAARALLAGMPAGQDDLRDELSAWQASLSHCQTQRRREAITAADYARERKRLTFKLLDIVQALADEPSPPALPSSTAADSIATTTPPRVFLSYSRKDSEAAKGLRADLEAGGVSVVFDVDAARPGEAVTEFVRRSIRETDATVMLLSEHSLLSDWVALETGLALSALDLWGERRLLACYLDDRFLADDFRLAATRHIDERIAAIESQLPEYAAQRLDSNDLNARKTRLYTLRNQLGVILERLRACLCLDLRPATRAASVAGLLSALRGTG